MKKMLLLAVLITGVLANFSINADYTRGETENKGWPIPYQQIETNSDPNSGLCCGIPSICKCEVTVPSNNYLALAGDIVLCATAGLALAYGTTKIINPKKKNT